jgi:hypothetical protein
MGRLFDSSTHSSEEKGDGQRRTAQRRGSERRLSGTVSRRKKGAEWAMGQSGRVGRMPLGPARRENKEENGMGHKDDWAEMENQLQI